MSQGAPGYAVLTCNGLDKPEGSIAREVALRSAELGLATIVCPVVLNRTPARYRQLLAESRLLVVDGCATRCASRLAGAVGFKPTTKLVVSEFLKKAGQTLPSALRLGPEGLQVAGDIVAVLEATVGAPAASSLEGAGPVVPVPTLTMSPSAEPVFALPTDHLVVVYDKYEFRIPHEGFYFNPNDVWVQVAGNRARVGISDYLQQRLTDITYVDPPALGTTVSQFGELGTVESTKANFEVVSPASGKVVRVNEQVCDAPELINEDPYGSWIVELELTDWEEDQGLLMDAQTYAHEVERKAAEY